MIHLALWLISFCFVIWFGVAAFAFLVLTWRIWVPFLVLLVAGVLLLVNSKDDKPNTPVALNPPQGTPLRPIASESGREAALAPARVQAMRDSMANAISQPQGSQLVVPEPAFSDIGSRLAYLNWLGSVSDKLKNRKPDLTTRIEFLKTLWYESKRAGLEPALLLALIDQTSGFDQHAIAESGARGYMQVAAHWADTIGDRDTSRLLETHANLRYGCVILRNFLDEAGGDLTLALSRYEAQAFHRDVVGRAAQPDAFVNAVFGARNTWVVPTIRDSQVPRATSRSRAG